jgi:hypothetical protein
MNTYSIMGTIIMLVPIALIVGIIVKQGKRIFEE